MSPPKNPTLPPSLLAKVLDLDEYRKLRELRGDWPPTWFEQEVFFSQFRKAKPRGKV